MINILLPLLHVHFLEGENVCSTYLYLFGPKYIGYDFDEKYFPVPVVSLSYSLCHSPL